MDEVEKFTLSVYDKNQVLIYDSEIKPMENWSVEEFGLVYGYNRVVFEAGIEEYITVKSAPADGYWGVKVEKIHWSEETGEEMLDTYYGLVNVDGSVAYLLSMNALKEKFKDNEISLSEGNLK